MLLSVTASVEAWLGKASFGVDLFRHAKSTQFPQVAMLATWFGLIWWAWMTLLALVATWVAADELGDRLSQMKVSRLLTVVALSPIVAGLCIVAFFALPGDPSFSRGLTTGSRIGYALMGSLILPFSALCAGYWPAFLYTLLSKIFVREK